LLSPFYPDLIHVSSGYAVFIYQIGKEPCMKRKLLLGLIGIALLALGFTSAIPIASAQRDMSRMNPLAPLKNALNTAGAPGLTAEQESRIQELLKEFRDAHRGPIQNEDIPNARTAYEDAILNGDSAAAAAQARVLGNAQAAEMVQRESDAADFAINVINILRADPGQADAVIAQIGERDFVRMILRLVGGPVGPGGPGPRRGQPPLPPESVAP
jgi:hypothetical protein